MTSRAPDTEDLRLSLENGLNVLGVEAPASSVETMLAFLRLLGKWNERFNLSGIRDPGDMIPRHLLDSLAVSPYVRGPRVLDVGTGAGLPGIPLALVNPRYDFVLLDASGKKTRFLVHAVASLGLNNVVIQKNRVEDYRDESGFDTVVCRAVADLATIVQMAGHLCAQDGRILAMKGRYPEHELKAVSGAWRVHGITRLEVPGLSAERHLVEMGRAPV